MTAVLVKCWAHRCAGLQNWDRCSSNAEFFLISHHASERWESHRSPYLFCPWSVLRRETAELHFMMKAPQPDKSAQAWNQKILFCRPAVNLWKDNNILTKKFQLVTKSNKDFELISLWGFKALLCLNGHLRNPEKVIKFIKNSGLKKKERYFSSNLGRKATLKASVNAWIFKSRGITKTPFTIMPLFILLESPCTAQAQKPDLAFWRFLVYSRGMILFCLKQQRYGFEICVQSPY